MTVLTRTPDNTNILQPTKFLVTIDRIPNAQYFCQKANIPGATMPEAPLVSPFHNYTIAGLNIQYNSFEMTFIVDESLQAWQDIYNWFLAISSPVSFDERNMYQALQNPMPTKLPSYSDLYLTILSNLNNSTTRVHFVNAFPTSITDIDFDTTQSADDVITATARFSYEYFEFEPA
jgi:hypothetical protein